MPFTEKQRAVMLDSARRSIAHGLQHGCPLPVDPTHYDPPLCDDGASFVTLHKDGELRGCIGSLEAHRPLIRDIAENAYAAAFRDTRFQRLQKDELNRLSIDISVLSTPRELPVANEQELMRRLRPGMDGVILEDGRLRGTFLPTVWEALPEPADFVTHLKLKAGLPADYWSDGMRVWRYTTECFGEEDHRATSSC